MWCLNALYVQEYPNFTRRSGKTLVIMKEVVGSSDISTNETRLVMLAILEDDWRFTISEIWDLLVEEQSIEVSRITVQHILTAEGYTKVCVRWVPKQLTVENKGVWVNTVWKFLVQHAGDSTMISRIIRGEGVSFEAVWKWLLLHTSYLIISVSIV